MTIYFTKIITNNKLMHMHDFCNMIHCKPVKSSTYENVRDQQSRRKEFNQLKDQRAFPGERIL